MKTINTMNFQKLLCLCFLIVAQLTFSQKNNSVVSPKNTLKSAVKVNKAICNCDKVDFQARIFKLKTINDRGNYKLQLIDFVNRSNCEIKWLSLYWKDHPNITFSSMKNKKFEKSEDGSVALYEFEFETRMVNPELEDGAEDMVSLYVELGGKKCLIKNKRSTYYRQP